MYKRTTYSIFSFDWFYISDLMTYVEREWWLSILLSAFAKRCLFISGSHYFVWISWWNYRYLLLPLKIGSEYQNLHGNSWVLLCVIMDGFLDCQRLTNNRVFSSELQLVLYCTTLVWRNVSTLYGFKLGVLHCSWDQTRIEFLIVLDYVQSIYSRKEKILYLHFYFHIWGALVIIIIIFCLLSMQRFDLWWSWEGELTPRSVVIIRTKPFYLDYSY